eukprot:scaffold25005_cov113-Cylindrotheca_fusiformis.AAC.1
MDIFSFPLTASTDELVRCKNQPYLLYLLVGMVASNPASFQEIASSRSLLRIYRQYRKQFCVHMKRNGPQTKKNYEEEADAFDSKAKCGKKYLGKDKTKQENDEWES